MTDTAQKACGLLAEQLIADARRPDPAEPNGGMMVSAGLFAIAAAVHRLAAAVEEKKRRNPNGDEVRG